MLLLWFRIHETPQPPPSKKSQAAQTIKMHSLYLDLFDVNTRNALPKKRMLLLLEGAVPRPMSTQIETHDANDVSV